MSRITAALLALLTFVATREARAVDGVIEIRDAGQLT